MKYGNAYFSRYVPYDIDENNSFPRVKVGDGENYVNDLPFSEAFTEYYKDKLENVRAISTDEIDIICNIKEAVNE